MQNDFWFFAFPPSNLGISHAVTDKGHQLFLSYYSLFSNLSSSLQVVLDSDKIFDRFLCYFRLNADIGSFLF